MTPFGARLRALRDARGVTLSGMAASLQISAAYLSALEHGRRGRPSAGLIQQVNDYFGLWDDELTVLARLTELANLLALRIRALPAARIAAMRALLED